MDHRISIPISRSSKATHQATFLWMKSHIPSFVAQKNRQKATIECIVYHLSILYLRIQRFLWRSRENYLILRIYGVAPPLAFSLRSSNTYNLTLYPLLSGGASWGFIICWRRKRRRCPQEATSDSSKKMSSIGKTLWCRLRTHAR